MENIIKTILETIKKITDNLDKTSKLALLTALGLFILSKIISIFAVYHKYNVTTISINKSNNKASDRKVYSYEEKNITSRR